MVGYVCKYTPLELIECFGEDCMKIDPDVKNFEKSDAPCILICAHIQKQYLKSA